jgi:hypothetical protein
MKITNIRKMFTIIGALLTGGIGIVSIATQQSASAAQYELV